MLGERLKRARLMAGLSLRALGERVDLSQTAIQKYELGTLTPGSPALLKLAKGTGVKVEYFFRPSDVTLRGVEFRKKASLGKGAQEVLVAALTEQVERRAELTSFFPDPPLARFTLPPDLPAHIRTPEDIEVAAEAMRRAWDLGQDPIPDMVDTLENGGIWVFILPDDAGGKMNGICAQADDVPVVAVAATWPGDRQRFTLAHELGHLVLQGRMDPGLELDEEHACHRFAGAFLVPRAAMLRELGATRHRLELRELVALKQQFGLSMQASLYRARDLGIISGDFASNMWIRLSKMGYRSAEPFAPPPEFARTFEQLVFRALAEGIIGDSKAAELLAMPLSTFQAYRMPKAPDGPPAHQ
jgi:Zn-dependent peptidase ImmA (M78 family)/transcriptional regulator with XRE-family HTH domain